MKLFPSQDQNGAQLQASMATTHNFMMVARRIGDGHYLDVYVALPEVGLLPAFDGFELIPDHLVPLEIDMLLFAPPSARQLTQRFKFRDRRARAAKANSVRGPSRS